MQKVALITGGSRGIGKATAEEFAKNGYNVAIIYKSHQEVAEKLAKTLSEKYQTKVVAIETDISDETQINSLKTQIEQEFSRLDILVNNAGIVFDKDFQDRTLADFQKTFEVNVFGTFLMSKIFGKMILATANTGSIINISSTSGISDFTPTSIDYAASKAAIVSLTKDLAIEFAPQIRVNTIAPGWVDTDMNKDLPEELFIEMRENFLLGRLAEPTEIANLIYFVASEKASFINGAYIPIDGGRK